MEYLVIIIAILIIGLFIAWQIYKNGLKPTIRSLIVEAERLLEDNQDKFNTVVAGVLVRLPIPFNLIPVSFIEKLVQKIFDEVKICLDYRPEEKEG
jgi:K+ transporter